MTLSFLPGRIVRAHLGILLSSLLGMGCVSDADQAVLSSPLIYGKDDRREYHQAPAGAVRTVMSEAMVALVPRARLKGSLEVMAGPLDWRSAARLPMYSRPIFA